MISLGDENLSGKLSHESRDLLAGVSSFIKEAAKGEVIFTFHCVRKGYRGVSVSNLPLFLFVEMESYGNTQISYTQMLLPHQSSK